MNFSILLFAFIASTHATNLQCNFQTRNFAVVGTVYTCDATFINMSSSTVLQNVSGIHFGGKGNLDVEFLFVRNQVIDFVPKNIETFFPRLKGISWSNTTVESITASDLQYPDLAFLNFYLNKVVTLDGDLFKFTPKLQWIHLNGNLIEHVGLNIITDLKELRQIWIQGNPCIDTFAQTPQQIQDLIDQSPKKCPPMKRSEDKCPDGCLEIIQSLESQVVELTKQNNDILSDADALRYQVIVLSEKISKYGEIFEKFEKFLDDLGVGSCPSKIA